jgi:Amt family ammonium transporter
MEKRNFIPLIILLVISILGAFIPNVPTQIVTEGINSGDTAWMLVSSALVLLMTPGLAYFYGGMVNTKNVISTMLQSFIAMGVISVVWVVFGFSLAFGEDIGGFVGNPMSHFMFKGVLDGPVWGTIPFALFAMARWLSVSTSALTFFSLSCSVFSSTRHWRT